MKKVFSEPQYIEESYGRWSKMHWKHDNVTLSHEAPITCTIDKCIFYNVALHLQSSELCCTQNNHKLGRNTGSE